MFTYYRIDEETNRNKECVMKNDNKKNPFFVRLSLLPFLGITTIANKLGQSEKLMHMMNKRTLSPKQKRKAFANYQPTNHDVFVCTYSKSGTNWTMQIAHQIAHYGEAKFDNIYDVIPWPDTQMPAMAKLNERRLQKRAPTGLRVIKTHLESDYVPYTTEAKYIVIIRDPKDVFVSSYYFGKDILQMMEISYSAAEWFEQFTSDHFFFGSWPAHTASYWPWRQHDNVLLLTFNEMKRDLRAVCQQIADLMNVNLTSTQLDLVVEKSSFQYMKGIDYKFIPHFLSVGRSQRPVMVRSGKSGVSGTLLNPQQQTQLDAFCQAELKRLGSDFPYLSMFTNQETTPSV